jgi:hypothetical protein
LSGSEFPKQFFCPTVRIDVGAIEQVDAGIPATTIQPGRHFFISFIAEGHGAKG